jgi:general secretion pathway protein F
MPRYHYVALDTDGRRRTGGIDAVSETAAQADLKRRKLLPVQLAPEGVQKREQTARPQERSGIALSHKARAVITRQLATLVDAAVPVEEALGMIAAQQEQESVKRIVASVRADVTEGRRLAEALGRHPRSFSGLYRAAVAGGERSGNLGLVLTRLADYLSRVHAQRSKVLAAMVYPAALVCVATCVVSCLMIFVVPSLAEQFESFDARLPLLTQILIAVSKFLSMFWAVLLIGIFALVFAVRRALRQPAIREAADGALLRAPVIGRWVVAVNASRFVRAVSTLVTSGLPILESIRAARESLTNRVAAKAAERMADWIEEGESLSQAMRRSGVIPPMVAYMAASGENAGDLPGMLEKAADHLDQEFEAFTNSAISLFEPAVIIFMGVVVASIVLAIMLPVLQLNRLAIG